jgi:hypothetical protein
MPGDIGKVITVNGVAFAGGTAGVYATVITGYVDHQNVTVRDAAPAFYRNASVVWGTDNAAAFTAWTTALAGTTAGQILTGFIPAGHYCTTQTIALPYNCNILADPAAVIHASASMPALLTTPTSTKASYQVISGGYWDANNLAVAGINPGWFGTVTLRDLIIDKATQYGVKAGDGVVGCTGLTMMNCTVQVSRTYTTSGSIGVWLPSTTTDNTLTDVIVQGYQTGFYTASGGNFFTRCHAWARQSVGTIQDCFVDTLGNTYVQCYADTPTRYGWWLQSTAAQAKQKILDSGCDGRPHLHLADERLRRWHRPYGLDHCQLPRGDVRVGPVAVEMGRSLPRYRRPLRQDG